MTNKVHKVHLQSDKTHHSEIKLNSNSNILKLRSRIHKILDEQFKLLSERFEKEKVLSKYSKEKDSFSIEAKINESRLQEWVQMFKNQILLIEEKQNYEIKGNAHSKKQRKLNFDDRPYLQSQLKIMSLPKPSVNALNSIQSILWTIQDKNLRIFQRKPKNTQKSNRINEEQSSTQHFDQTLYQLPQNILKQHCSINHSKQLNSLIIIGGCKPSNPNIKSSKIYSLNLKSSSLQIIEKLPYGLSSHSAILHEKRSQIYIIGGNRNHSIVTRGFFRLDLLKMQVAEISCLNYPAASMNCVLWKQRWIYKFGGVGEAFGAWNTSPYIQRYSIQDNQWEMINPSIDPSLSANILPKMFLAKSSSYVCENRNQIIVFGGFDIKGNFKNHSFVLKIQENHESDENNDDQTGHLIKDFGKIENSHLDCSNFTFLVNSQSQVSMFGIKNGFEDHEIESNAPFLMQVFY